MHRQGLAFARQKQWREAAANFRRALQLEPEFPEAHFCLGRVLAVKGHWTQAVACFEEALRLRPKFPAVLNRLGAAYSRLHRWKDAVACYLLLVRRQPTRASAHQQLGAAYAELGQLELAQQHLENALSLRPNHAAARVDRAVLWLKQGDFERGWTEYEWRWRLPGLRPRSMPKALWDGTSLTGRRILLHTEQGMGDTLQFVRYAAVLQASGAHVILLSPPALARLLARCSGIDELVLEGAALPPFDVHAPLLSLPGLLRTNRASIPAQIPYLSADPERIEAWRRKLESYHGLKIGIAWQGNPNLHNDACRSTPLAHFEPLAAVPRVHLFSLQKHVGTVQLTRLRSRFPVVDLVRSADLAAGPFMDTAAIMKTLDLVIACDTAVAHLAGALGVPVWLLLSAGNSDWRWMENSTQTPWYPTMRLFRQKTQGDWLEVFQRLAAALNSLSHSMYSTPTLRPPEDCHRAAG